jgi:hypothetical protein
VIEQRQRVRHQDRRRQALRGARGDQEHRRRGQCACERSQREDRKAPYEYPFGAYAVTERAGGQNEGSERDGIGGHHPLQLGDAAAERGADAAQRGIDDGDVELHHAKAEAHGRKRQRPREMRME